MLTPTVREIQSDAIARMWMGSPFAPPVQYQPPYSYAQGTPPYVAPPPPPEDHEPDEPPQRKSSPVVGERKSSPDDGMAAMRRELDELKQLIREGAGAKPRKKRGR